MTHGVQIISANAIPSSACATSAHCLAVIGKRINELAFLTEVGLPRGRFDGGDVLGYLISICGFIFSSLDAGGSWGLSADP